MITVTVMTRLLRNANMARDPLTVTSIKEGNSVLKWYKDNYLLSNPEKLNAIGIKQRNETEHIKIKIGDQAIKTTDNIKLLGVNFDENLIFSQHISELCKKASQRVGVLARLRNLITTETKLLLYKTAIMPYLTYCHLTWHFCKASDTRKVERIQERALRIVRFITYIQKRI